MNRLTALGLIACLMWLAACSETRFESPPGQNIALCDTHLAGLWLARARREQQSKQQHSGRSEHPGRRTQ